MTSQAADAPTRARAVDALRGLAILAMVLVSTQPAHILPAWMYHAQEPPPTHALNEQIGGLTWPDIVFPFFLFALGIAIPLALSRKLDRGVPRHRILLSAFHRWFLLLVFAYAREHLDMDRSGLAEPLLYVVALLGFAALFLIFVRLSAELPRRTVVAVRAGGWTLLVALLALLPEGAGLELRVDSILVALAYASLLGSVIWLVTRGSTLTRLAILAVVMTWRLSGWTDGWLAGVENWTPIPGIYHFSLFQDLCIVIPGTIAGDLLLEWMRERRKQPNAPGWPRWRFSCVVAASLLLIPVVLIGVQSRALFLTTMVVSGILAALLFVLRHPADADGRLVRQLAGWGSFALLFGLLLDPFDQGMKKIPGNFSWFYASTGLAFFALAALLVVTDVWEENKSLQLLIENGENPMIAYVAWEMLLGPTLHLAGMERFTDAYASGYWSSTIVGVLSMLAVALVVQQFTRRKIFWRT